MKLSILDQMIIPNGLNANEGLLNSVRLAKMAEASGFERIWYSEHHGMEGLFNSAPELMIAYMSNLVPNIRLGSGGVMMPNHTPYKLAEQFKTLSLLTKGNVDLGIGRAPGGTTAASKALHANAFASADSYPEIRKTLEYLQRDGSPNKLFAAPVGVQLPPVWLLGSSGQSSIEAGKMGINYAHAQFIGGFPEQHAIASYREHFKPSVFATDPYVLSCVHIITAPTIEEAKYQASSLELYYLLLATGQTAALYDPEIASNYPYTEREKDFIETFYTSGRFICGTVELVAEKLESLQSTYDFDEMMVVSNMYDQDLRIEGLKKLRDFFA